MKKYDFILLGLYILPVLVLIISMWTYKQVYFNSNEKSLEYITELYMKPVTQVVIRNTDVKYRVIRDSTRKIDFAGRFELKGRYDRQVIDQIKVSGDTLLLEGDFRTVYDKVSLYIGDQVKVDTVNAPETQLIGLSVTKDSE
ncbi:MAG: hypothetical protein EGP82_12175 [Odoribacter splanchnicus]|nr:hypothetical protein [Odoribacter splanchnicus]